MVSDEDIKSLMHIAGEHRKKARFEEGYASRIETLVRRHLGRRHKIDSNNIRLGNTHCEESPTEQCYFDINTKLDWDIDSIWNACLICGAQSRRVTKENR